MDRAFLTLDQPWQTAVTQTLKRLDDAGFFTQCTFDLQSVSQKSDSFTKSTESDQMVIILVSTQDCPPLSLVVIGHEGRTAIFYYTGLREQINLGIADKVREVIANPTAYHS